MTRENKYDVTFDGPRVSFRLRRRYAFDSATTSMECPACRQNDTLTIISPWYAQIVGNMGGEELLAWHSVSLYISGLLQQATGDMSTPWNLNNTLAILMGDFLSPPTTSLLKNSHSELATFAFGPWLYNQTAAPYSDILQNFTITAAEMRALYSVLGNASLLGGLSLTSHDSHLFRRCSLWANELCHVGGARRASLNLSLAACGVIYLIHTCGENVSLQAREVLQEAFCPMGIGSDPCLNFLGGSSTISDAYAHAFSDYFTFLSSYFLNVFLEQKQLRLVESRPQNQLALGFQIQVDSSFVPSTFYNGLILSEWGTERGEIDPLWTVYTCLQNRDMDNNMKLIEYNHNWFSPVGLQFNPDEKYSLSAHTDFGTSCGHLQTCTHCSSPISALNFYVETLQRPVAFRFSSHTSLWGVDVYRYEMAEVSIPIHTQLPTTYKLTHAFGGKVHTFLPEPMSNGSLHIFIFYVMVSSEVFL
ncbi:hypothetical protein ElyMa_002701000 [Elysia marginata]|uniref:Uncharacterized protein n=1 Tax=Elysia marginata TaxID=1093978 RepID=A0AAV4HGH9_9GAST|nr:hypothetical protein ElyMa_002701000 [Elysia marginata]